MYDLNLAAGDDRFSDRRLDNIIDWPKGGPTDRAAILHTRRKPSTDPADPTARLCVARDDQPFDCSTVKFPQDSVETTGSEPISTCPIEQLIDGALFVAASRSPGDIQRRTYDVDVRLEHFSRDIAGDPSSDVVGHQVKQSVERLVRSGNDEPREWFTPVELLKLPANQAKMDIDRLIVAALKVRLGPATLLMTSRHKTLQRPEVLNLELVQDEQACLLAVDNRDRDPFALVDEVHGDPEPRMLSKRHVIRY
jgi:hypothetical protein